MTTSTPKHVKHTPATPLPWKHEAETATHRKTRGPFAGTETRINRVVGSDDAIVASTSTGFGHLYADMGDDMAYIAHAANAYPRLVAALRELTLRCDGEEGIRADGSNIQTIAAHAILEKLGEI